MPIDHVRAAGAVVLRGEGNAREFLAVHRPQYDDWSLPKGKLEAGELLPVCATREVAEETGAIVRLDVPLGTTSYKAGGQSKKVHFWRAEVITIAGHVPDHEVDEVRWVPVGEAAAELDYPAEAALVDRAARTPWTVPLIITRHGKAMERRRWALRDSARPITHRGRHQAREVARVLAAFGVGRITSSSSNRCVGTMLPFATQARLPIERATILSEEKGTKSPSDVKGFTQKLARSAVADRVPTVVCGHRPVLPAMLAGLGIDDRSFRTGESAVVNLTDGRAVHSVEWIRTIS